ncbi:MAG: phosphoserine phosphatase RsbU/P [Actinomycetota bacterium]|jgi:PAS domain S-box-containing protein|nr:phosphoserine phosphatase RsbU/P [Actinomycetota bacterium]
MANVRPAARKGSWSWVARVAELTGWGTAALIVLILNVGDIPPSTYSAGLTVVACLGIWLLIYFRAVLPRREDSWWTVGIPLVQAVGFGCMTFALLHDHVASAQVVFVPVIVSAGLLAGLTGGLSAAALSAAGYLAITNFGTGMNGVAASFTGGIFLLSGSIAGLLSRELRSHYRGEQEEHRLATAVRHRLMAVVDAVDEAIVFRDRQGTVRVANRRVAALFGFEPDDHVGQPGVELLRQIARQTDDPEELMEFFQTVRDLPEQELRRDIEQIIPVRRKLRVFSGPTFDEKGTLVGRIDVFTDITEAAKRAEEIEVLYMQARKTAESYQRGLLPVEMPRLPRVGMVAHYIAAAGSRAVCGDFYDFVPLAEGRVGLVLGDVCGIGPKAANDAALTRYTLRSFAEQISDPGALLQWMNAHIRRQSAPERFVRLIVGVLDPERAVLDYANAGHVPPIVYRAATGEVEWLGEGGIPLGIEDDARYKAGHVELAPGDMVILYTDGVTEAPRDGRPFGQGRLTDLITQYGVGSPGELVQAIRRGVESWAGNELRDDIAMLIFQIAPDKMLSEPVREIVLPNEPSRISEIRRFVAAFLADLRAPVETSSEILLAVGEAAGNAYRHGRRNNGRSEIRVRCEYERPEFSVEVTDDGPGFDLAEVEGRGTPDPFAQGGRGLFLMKELMDGVTVDCSGQGTTVHLHRSLT